MIAEPPEWKGELEAVMKMTRNSGFTLIELMVTMSVVAVLLSAGVPSFGALIKNNRLVTENYALRTVLGAARFEAQMQRQAVTVCRSANGIDCSTGDWGEGYMAFIDLDGNEQLDDDEQLLQSRVQNTQGIAVRYSQSADILRFDSSGNAVDNSGTFTICDDRGAVEARGIIVSAIGAVRAAVVSEEEVDAMSIVKDHAGNDVSCS
jgi:type IV fimbrial biogenesis protein FimT